MQRQIFGGMVGVGLLCAVLAGTALHSLGYAPPRDHPRDPLRAAVVWGCVAAGLGLGSHWMARRLTRRLVALQRKVEAWGQGRLAGTGGHGAVCGAVPGVYASRVLAGSKVAGESVSLARTAMMAAGRAHTTVQ